MLSMMDLIQCLLTILKSYPISQIFQSHSLDLLIYEMPFIGKTMPFAPKTGHADDLWVGIEIILRFMDNPDNYGAMHYPPIEMLTRGAYAYYVHQYLKWFKREQILILNSNDLKYQPAQILKQVQEFMGVPLAVDEKNFIMDEESGHYCIIGEN